MQAQVGVPSAARTLPDRAGGPADYPFSQDLSVMRRSSRGRSRRARTFRAAAIDIGGRPRGTSTLAPVNGESTPMDMQEQTVVVTGGASGIGKATAFLLARQGARVLIGDIDEAGGRIAAAEGAAERLAIDYLLLDLADKPSIDAFAADVHQRVARVNGLVNGAGWDQIQPFLENPPEMWDRVIAVNLMGAVWLTRGL